jgi:hypothetical protein
MATLCPVCQGSGKAHEGHWTVAKTGRGVDQAREALALFLDSAKADFRVEPGVPLGTLAAEIVNYAKG